VSIYALTIIIAVAALAGGHWWVMSGFWNGDRVGDARVTALLRTAGLPGDAAPSGQGRPEVVACVRNPSDTPLLVALRVRRTLLPSLLADPHTVTVPRWTARRRFQAGEYGTVGVVPDGGTARLVMRVPVSARHCLVTVIVGQAGGRLRVHRLRVGAAGSAAEGRDEASSPCLLP
jgi:hypothetical protein